jgi:hypothetical protein
VSNVAVTAVAAGPMLRAALVRCRIDARRPASWLGLAAVALAAGVLPGAASMWWPALPFVTGGLAAAAAIGGPPRAGAGAAAAWAMTRAGWPLAGLAIAGLAGRCDPWTTTTLAVAILVTAASIAVALERSAAPGDAASLALVAVGCAAAAAIVVRVGWPAAAGAACATGALAWSAVAGSAAIRPWREIGGEFLSDDAPAGWGMAFGACGGLWLHAAMISGLAGMAAWLLLAPERAWCYALLAAGWFVAAAVPLATLGPGASGEAARRSLAATAARGVGRRWLLATPGAAGAPATLGTAATFAAILGWPPLVADLLTAEGPATGGNLLVSAGLAAAAVATTVIVAGVTRVGGTRDSALAVAMTVALAAACVATAKSGDVRKSPAGRVRTEVERSAGSCKTPPCSPRHGGSVSCLDYPAFVFAMRPSCASPGSCSPPPPGLPASPRARPSSPSGRGPG